MKKIFLALLLLFCSFSNKAQTYFPPLTGTTWDTISPSQLGWCSDSIQNLYNWLENSNSKAFILLKDGKIVLEKYFGTFTADSVHVWNSAGKTLTAYAVGIAQESGLININAPISTYIGNGWSSMTTAQENAITIRHQLTMTTGMDDGVADPYCTDVSCLQYLAPPGTRWAYHNAPYTMLDTVLETVTGLTLSNYVYQKIGSKIGMPGLYIQNGYNNVFVSKARGFARFGLLLSQNGVWNGTTVLGDQIFLNDMRNTSQTLNQSYGYLTWLNGKSSYMIPQSQFVFNGSLMPNGPDDVYAAEGKNGQIINVVPSNGIVFIRMGDNLGSSLIATQYNDTIWQYLNRLDCTLALNESTLSELQLIPNPSKGQFSFNINLNDTKVQVISIDGKTAEVTKNGEIYTLTNPIPGSYFVIINTPTLTTHRKLILE